MAVYQLGAIAAYELLFGRGAQYLLKQLQADSAVDLVVLQELISTMAVSLLSIAIFCNMVQHGLTNFPFLCRAFQ